MEWVCIYQLPSWICKSCLSRLQISYFAFVFHLSIPRETSSHLRQLLLGLLQRNHKDRMDFGKISFQFEFCCLFLSFGTAQASLLLAGARRSIQTPGFHLCLEGCTVLGVLVYVLERSVLIAVQFCKPRRLGTPSAYYLHSLFWLLYLSCG